MSLDLDGKPFHECCWHYVKGEIVLLRPKKLRRVKSTEEHKCCHCGRNNVVVREITAVTVANSMHGPHKPL